VSSTIFYQKTSGGFYEQIRNKWCCRRCSHTAAARSTSASAPSPPSTPPPPCPLHLVMSTGADRGRGQAAAPTQAHRPSRQPAASPSSSGHSFKRREGRVPPRRKRHHHPSRVGWRARSRAPGRGRSREDSPARAQTGRVAPRPRYAGGSDCLPCWRC
jgi:hypothetical protein